MPSTTLEILIKTMVDKAIADLKKTGQATKDLGESGEKSAPSIDSLSSAFTGLNQAVELGIKVYQAVKKVYDETVGSAKELTDEVIDLTRIQGDNTETASRTIQVIDDLGLSYSEFKNALITASRQGLDVSWEGLKRIATEYQSLPSQVERVNFVTKTFGRSSEELGKFLSQNADQLERMAKESKKALVLSDDQLKIAKTNEILKDGIKDSTEALKVQAGINIMAAENVNLLSYKIREQASEELALIQKQQGHALSSEQLNQFYKERWPLIEREIQGQIDAQWATEQNASANNELSIALQNATTKTKELEDAQKSVLEKTAGQFESALRGAGVEGGKLYEALSKLDEIYGTQTKANQELQDNIKTAAESYAKTGDITAWGTALQGVKDQVLGPLNQQIEDNKKKVKELNEELTKLNGRVIRATVLVDYETIGTAPLHRVNP